MGWKDLLQTPDERIIVPWLGGRDLSIFGRSWTIVGRLPNEYGWHEFKIEARKATWNKSSEPNTELLKEKTSGYLVGDRLVPDNARVETDPKKLAEFPAVYLLEDGLDRFARITVGRFKDDGPLIFDSMAFPLGPEDEVLKAYLDEKQSINDIAGVVPALDAAFRFENWQRAEAERRRIAEEARRAEEERQRVLEEKRKELVEKLGDGAGRRQMAHIDFAAAAKAALAVGNAQFLDERRAYRRGEHIVRFRLNHRRFECVCNENLRIIEAGVCLTDENSGIKSDNELTLESLPSVIMEADRLGVLVVFRHVD